MPQELHVLRCYSCSMFQVHIVKRSIQWNCKVCNEKQSLTKVYARGTGKDCRIIAQKLNELRKYQQDFKIEETVQADLSRQKDDVNLIEKASVSALEHIVPVTENN